MSPLHDDSKDTSISEQDREMLIRFARKIVAYHMTAPAIFALECSKPLNIIGNQFLVFFEPVFQTLIESEYYTRIMKLLENRNSIEEFIQMIEKEQFEKDNKERRKGEIDGQRENNVHPGN